MASPIIEEGLNPRSDVLTDSAAESRGPKTAHFRENTAQPMFLKVPEVAAILRTSSKAIYSMIDRGQLPGVTRLRRRVLVRRVSLLEWLDHNCASSLEKKR